MVVVIDMITGEVHEDRSGRVEKEEYEVQQRPEHSWQPMIQPGLQEILPPQDQRIPPPRSIPPGLARVNVDDFLRQMDDTRH